MDQTQHINIEVAFATQDQQIIIKLQIPVHTHITDIIKASKIQESFPEFDLLNMPIGIFGKRIDPNTYQIKDGDRIEIYRPLNKTPNQRRLERARANEN